MSDPIFSFSLKRLLGIFTPRNPSEAIRRISFILVLVGFIAGTGFFFYKIFNYLFTFSLFGQSLSYRIIENLLLFFFFMILFSNFLTGMTTYFRSPELNFYFSMPIEPNRIFRVKYLETASFASWASLTVVFPMLLSLGLIKNLNLFLVLILIFTIFIFAQISASIGNLIILLLLKFFPRIGCRFNIATIGLGAILAGLYFQLGKPQLFRVFEMGSEIELTRFLNNLGRIGTIYLPSNWLAIFARKLFSGYIDLHYLLLLFFTTLALYLILSEFGANFYYRIWLKQQELTTGRKREFSLFFRLRAKRAQLITKDIVMFLRNPTQWVQLLIFFILMIIYIFSIYRLKFFFTSSFWRALIGFGNFGYVSFLFATLGVRFIYPSISLEGRSFQLIQSLPVKMRNLLLAKLIFYSVPAIILGEILIFTTGMTLAIDPFIMKVSLFLIAIVIITIVSINLGIGCLMPDFNEPNPAKLAAGGGGVIGAIICLAYTFFTVAIFARPTLLYLRRGPASPDSRIFLFSLVIFIAISIATTFFFINLGRRNLERIES